MVICTMVDFIFGFGPILCFSNFFWATNFMNWKNFENTTFFVCVCFFFGVGGFKPCWFHGSVEVFRSPEKTSFFFFGIPCEKYPECNCRPPLFSKRPDYSTSFRRRTWQLPRRTGGLGGASRGMCEHLVKIFFRFETCGHTWDVPRSQYMVSKWLRTCL